MIKEFVERWDKNKGSIRSMFEAGHPEDYEAIVKAVISNITTDSYGCCAPDPDKIHQINDGDYQGTLLFVIAEKGYQPSKYYYCMVSYGSCSGCDTLEAIRCHDSGKPSKEQVDQYMMLALHIVQWIKPMEQSDYVCDEVQS